MKTTTLHDHKTGEAIRPMKTNTLAGAFRKAVTLHTLWAGRQAVGPHRHRRGSGARAGARGQDPI